jgi:hypothetical protein
MVTVAGTGSGELSWQCEGSEGRGGESWSQWRMSGCCQLASPRHPQDPPSKGDTHSTGVSQTGGVDRLCQSDWMTGATDTEPWDADSTGMAQTSTE